MVFFKAIIEGVGCGGGGHSLYMAIRYASTLFIVSIIENTSS